MCRPASFVITAGEVLFSQTSNSHEDIIEENNLNDKTAHPAFVRVEISPDRDDNYELPIKKWIYNVDQDLLPKWYDAKQCEKRCRAALKKWKKYHCCNQKGKYLAGGFGVTQESGDYSTQTAGGRSTQTAGYHSTQTAEGRSIQTAGHNSTQTARGYSIQKAGYHSIQKAGDSSFQTAGDFSTQKAREDSNQTAGDFSTQTAGDWSNQKAGKHSTQTAGNNSIQKGGLGAVQIGHWWHGIKFQVATRVVTEKEANKPYKFSYGEWEEINEDA